MIFRRPDLITYYSPSLSEKLLVLRTKSLIAYKLSPLFEASSVLIQSGISKSLFGKLKFARDSDDLERIMGVDKKLLPTEYGGSSRLTADEMAAHWAKELRTSEQTREILRLYHQLEINFNLIPKDSHPMDDLLEGDCGTFRKLEID